MAALGLFPYVDTLLNAATRFKGSGYKITIFSPIPIGHEIEHEMGPRKNPIKYLTFFGGVAGFWFGVLLAFGTSALYVLPRGGRPLFFITPTLLISYEAAILFGVFMSLLGFLVFAKLPSFKKDYYDPEVAVDSFGLLVESEDDFYEIEKILLDHGAFEVRKVEKK